MTVRLFRADAFQTTFEARIAQRLQHNGAPALVLDQTLFYPSAGGQPNDLGMLHEIPVIDVVEREDGEILHVLANPVDDGLREVRGEIDWARRFDHMQQHSGQHVLSQAFVVACGQDTQAVHIGAAECTLDLPGLPAAEAIYKAEQEANDVIYQDRPIDAYEVGEEQLPSIPLRKPPKVRGRIRIVEVRGYDWSACGGTHVRSTGQLGLIKVVKWEKRAGGTRITFRCGARALSDYRQLNTEMLALSESLSVGRPELSDAVSRLRLEAAATRKALADAQGQLLTYEANELLSASQPGPDGVRVIAQAYAARDMNQLRSLAKALTTRANTPAIALLGSAGERFALCLGRSPDLRHDMRELLKTALSASGAGPAKGGGSADFAQGGGPAATLAQVEAALAGALADINSGTRA